MVEINVTYQGDYLFKAVHRPSGVEILTDPPVDNRGKGRSFSPTDLVATALGTCMGTTMAFVAERDKIPLEGMKIVVQKEMTAKPIRRIGTLKVTFTLPQKLPQEILKKLERAALTCPVHASLHPEVKIVILFL